MPAQTPKRYWKSLAERDADPNFLEAAGDEFLDTPGADIGMLHRRSFLKAAGFAFAGLAVSGCRDNPLARAPVQNALPHVHQPEDLVPGRSYYYASTCGGCNAGCGILIKTREGRPIKLEGNPEHPLSKGGLCAVGQASLLGLYDSRRLQQPLKDGQEISWNDIDRDIIARLEEIRRGNGSVRILSGTVTSPTTLRLIQEFLGPFRDGRHVVYDVLSCAAILDAHEATHGIRVLPRYRFDRAETIVSFDADFLGTWISPVEYTHGYRQGRKPDSNPPRLSYHVQFESRLSLTGSKADQRFCVAPWELGLVLTHLASRLARRARVAFETAGIDGLAVPGEFLDRLAGILWHSRRRSLVVCGSQDPAKQKLCNFINHLLDNYGHTLDLDQSSLQRKGEPESLAGLLNDLRDGRVSALIVLDCNPVYDLAEGEVLAEAIPRLPLAVYCGQQRDETARACRYVCPPPHYLGSWSDAGPADGMVALCQPAVELHENTRPLLESLAAWMGRPRSALAILQESWRHHIFPRQTAIGDFQTFWDRTLHDGFAQVEPDADENFPDPGEFGSQTIQPVLNGRRIEPGTFELIVYPKVGMPDGRHAGNPWLQELPDPISKVAWDNYACLSPETAARLAVRNGDVVRLETAARNGTGKNIELPVLVQPGQHDKVVAVALGYGSELSRRFADIGPHWLQGRPTVGDNGLVGVNVSPLLPMSNGNQPPLVHITRVNGRHPLACTQDHHTITVPANLAPPGQERRPIIREMSLPVLQNPPPREEPEPHGDLWPQDHPQTGPRWGMVIDMEACTGCSACVVACQAENNVPVVGKDEVLRHREMHWLRIDRYYATPEETPAGGIDLSFQPMLCQHCGNAPCETVCPVLATVHSSEGLNQQIYNRCVGTRYCANNCPYKVRRFNWFDYPHEDTLQNLVLNPDVTVRSRGVMEKCSFCVQRIQEAKHEARGRDEPLRDGAIQTACQQSCPAQAIVFGDLNDPNSKVSQRMRSRRRYQVLAELNVRPAVGYLGLVRNRPGPEETSRG